MTKKLNAVLLFLVTLLLLPLQTLAVDFEIPEVTIDAELQEDGTVTVEERHTYEFDGDFEGLLREISPKKGASIKDFTAFENDDTLKVEQDDTVYKIFRSGEDETVTVEMHYQIVNGMEKFEDGAEFYWPFFDDRNESEYGDMTITITPPAPAEDVLFLGYDEAYETGRLDNDGAVTFYLGEVPEGRNADIRVIYDPELFPALSAQNGTIRDKAAKDIERLENEAVIFAENQQTANTIGTFTLPIAGSAIAALFGTVWLRSRRQKQAAAAKQDSFSVPEELMSLPATIHFTHSPYLTPNAMAAALLDLVRKGNVLQVSDNHFELLNRKTEFSHETALLQLLFDRVGDGHTFKAEDMENYTVDETNNNTYTESVSEWNKGVADEVKQHNFYNKHPKVRWTMAMAGLAFAAAAIYLGWYEVYGWMAASIVFAFVSFGFAAFYSTITPRGHEIRAHWKQLNKAMKNMDSSMWSGLSKDEKIRAFIYALGVDDKEASNKANHFSIMEPRDSSDPSMLANPAFLTTVFIAANTNSTAHASSSTASSGGGVGGGGGGSGAF